MELDPLSNDITSCDVATYDNAPKTSEEVAVDGKVEWAAPQQYVVSAESEAVISEVKEQGVVHEFPTVVPQVVKEDGLTPETNEGKTPPKLKVKKKKDKTKKVKKKKRTDKKEDGSTAKKVKKLKKKKLSSKKGDANVQQEGQGIFMYYACSVCDTKYTTIDDLYKHVLTHKNRVTSWDLRVQSLKLKKKLRKEQKRLKKEKIKQEAIKLEPAFELPKTLTEFVENLTGNGTNIDNGNVNSLPPSNTDQSNGLAIKAEQNSSNGEKNNILTDNLEQFAKLKRNGDLVNVNKAKWNKKGSQYTGTDETLRQAFNLEKIFKCGHCQKQFHLGYYLKLHVRSHTGEKPYSCEECGISFITASKLGRHKKRTHLSVRFVCRICRRPYTRLEFLTRHFNKQHAADKIEGEPYDYNAILPYLKELEEELQKKKEQEDAIKKEAQFDHLMFAPTSTSGSGAETKPYALWTFAGDDVKLEVKQEIKTEIPDQSEEPAPEDGFVDDSFVDDLPLAQRPTNLKNEDPSDDDDYFPSDTWLPPASPPLSPTPQRAEDQPRKRKRALTDADKSENPLKCSICEKKLSTASYMRIHMRTHTGDRPYKCYLCNKSFITSSKRNRHVMTHDKWVEKCKEKLRNEDGGDGEVKEEPVSDTEEGKLLSKLAKRSRRSKGKTKDVLEKLAGKEKRNRKKKPFACLQCCSRFAYPEGLQLHMHAHQTGEKPASSDLHPAGGYTCKYCLATFDDLQLGQEHELTHDPNAPKPYLCTVCGRSYQRKETMVYHRRHHDYPNKYQCDVCPKTFNLLCKLQRHLHSHRPDKFVVRYECPVCAHIFNTKYHIEMHLTTHEKEGVILQENRGQIIAMVMQNARKIPLDTNKTTSNLKDLAPDDERSRICNICGEIFSHFYSLEQHLKTHGSKFSLIGMEDLDERKYICKVCNKGFKLSYYLKLHSYTHTKEKPFICQQCGKGFITRGKLKRHLETHAGLKKYQCHICCKFFTRPSYLRIHVRTIHGHQDFNFKPDLEYDMEMPMAGSGVSLTPRSNL